MNINVWMLLAEIARINQSSLSENEKSRLKSIVILKLREEQNG